MHQNYVGNLVLIFTLVFELARPQKFGNVQTNRLTNRLTNRHFDEIINISKNIIFSMFTYKGFFADQNVMVSSNFFNHNRFSRFLDISKKKISKNSTFFHARSQYLIILCMVKKKIVRWLIGRKIYQKYLKGSIHFQNWFYHDYMCMKYLIKKKKKKMLNWISLKRNSKSVFWKEGDLDYQILNIENWWDGEW